MDFETAPSLFGAVRKDTARRYGVITDPVYPSPLSVEPQRAGYLRSGPSCNAGKSFCVLHIEGIEAGILRMKEDPLDDRKKQIILMEKAYGAEHLIHTSLLAQQKRLYQEIPAMAGGGPGSNAL